MESVDQAPGTWLNMVRRMRFNGLEPGLAGRVVKLVAFELAACADYVNGSEVRPGIARIAVECEIDYRTAKRCVAAIRDLGLIRLVRSGARRGRSDIYQLTMPADVLDRVRVLTPSEMDEAIEDIRRGNRRKTPAEGPTDDPGTGHSDPRTDTPVRVTPVPVQTPSSDTATGHAVPRAESTTGHAVLQYGSRHAPLPSQSTETTTTTEPTDLGVRTDVTAVDPTPSENDEIYRCGHGVRAPAQRDDGQPGCALCRVEARIATNGTAGTDPTRTHLRVIQGGAA